MASNELVRVIAGSGSTVHNLCHSRPCQTRGKYAHVLSLEESHPRKFPQLRYSDIVDLTLFQNDTVGELVPIGGSLPDGRPWNHQAFLPHPLPETSPELTGRAYRQVAAAQRALGALDATAARLPNPTLFRRATLRLEAQSTAALEGTYEPLERVLTAPPDTDDPSLREVINYVIVAETAFAWAAEGRTLSTSTLSTLQAHLVAGTKDEREFSGQLRPIQVVVGRRDDAPAAEIPVKAARYVPPPPGPDLEARMGDLLAWMQSPPTDEIDPVVIAALSHYAFEALHPFHDGNGRLGRLLIVLQLCQSGLLSEPTLSVSPWFEARRAQYYDSLLGVSTRGAWSPWVEFFAAGIADSAAQTTRRMVALADTQAHLKEQLKGSSIRTGNARVLIDFAVGRPTFTITEAAVAVGMQYPGTKKLIDSLVELGVLAPYGDRTYNRLFHAPDVMRILLQG